MESLDDRVLGLLDKGHTRADFVDLVGLAREAGLVLSPTFIPFMPWTSLEGYRDLLAALAKLGLIDHIAPIQLAIRLLIPAGSRLLELPELPPFLDGYDETALTHRWSHPDPRVDRLHETVLAIVERDDAAGGGRRDTFSRFWHAVHEACGDPAPVVPAGKTEAAEIAVPRLSEPWYCCAEPTADQFAVT